MALFGGATGASGLAPGFTQSLTALNSEGKARLNSCDARRARALARWAESALSFGSAPRALLVDHPAVGELDDAVAEGGVLFGVGDLNDGRALIVETLEEFHDLAALARMEV